MLKSKSFPSDHNSYFTFSLQFFLLVHLRFLNHPKNIWMATQNDDRMWCQELITPKLELGNREKLSRTKANNPHFGEFSLSISEIMSNDFCGPLKIKFKLWKSNLNSPSSV